MAVSKVLKDGVPRCLSARVTDIECRGNGRRNTCGVRDIGQRDEGRTIRELRTKLRGEME
jgi:hypothetical protein